MEDIFQLSIELYDTKTSQVVWSDRWEENWDNLPTIKGSLSDGLLKALDTKPKTEQKIDTTNPEAYEIYLKAKHKYYKRESTDDTDIARGLLQKAIELDDNLISAKNLLGTTYREMGDYDEALEIYISNLNQSEELVDKRGMGSSLIGIGNVYYSKGDFHTALDYFERSLAISEELGNKIGKTWALNNIGIIYSNKGDYDKALDYLSRSLAIQEELGDKRGMGSSLNNIGNVHRPKGDYEKALDCFDRSLAIREELGDKRGMVYSLIGIGNMYADTGDFDTAIDSFESSLTIAEEFGFKSIMGYSLNNMGNAYFDKGDYDKALDYQERSFAISEELGDKYVMGYSLIGIGNVHHNRGGYEKALEYLEKSLALQKEIGIKTMELETTTHLYLTYKHLGKEYGVETIKTFIKETEKIEYGLNFRIYQLLEAKSYLETAYNQVQDKASAMDEKLKAKFLSYPIPKAIVEEWEKVK